MFVYVQPTFSYILNYAIYPIKCSKENFDKFSRHMHLHISHVASKQDIYYFCLRAPHAVNSINNNSSFVKITKLEIVRDISISNPGKLPT